MEQFSTKEVSKGLKPILLFQGEQFEFSEKHQRIKNLFYGKNYFLSTFNVDFRVVPYE